MHYPVLDAPKRKAVTIDAFGGYRHLPVIGENEFYDMENLTADRYPVAAVRKPRGLYLGSGDVQGMISKDALCYVDGSRFVVNGYPVELGLSTAAEDCPKQLVSMGAKVAIFPDRVYINTADLTDHGSLDHVYSTQGPVSFTMCDLAGDPYAPDYIQSTPPEEPTDQQYWLDTSLEPHGLRQWSEATGLWVSVTTTYIRVAATGIGAGFDKDDGVEISGLQGLEADPGGQLAALEGNALIMAREEDAITIVGVLDQPVTLEELTSPVTVARQMPLVDFVVESGNRLWGCRYGLNRAGEVVNELYASKLGDMKNWSCYMGTSMDSYTVSLGTDGPFTGAITYGGRPHFFKAGCLHQVYGDYPANFQTTVLQCRGVQPGADKSLAIVNEVLVYQSTTGICAFDGSLPTEISQALGPVAYHGGVAAALGKRYYISLLDSQGTESLFVYDMSMGLWHRQDGPGAYLMCTARDEVYCATKDGQILALNGSGDPAEDQVSWMAQTGTIGAGLASTKRLEKLHLRMCLAAEGHVRAMVEYDTSGVWQEVGYMEGQGLRSFLMAVRPRRCDHFRLRLEGVGEAMIFAMTKTITEGSDIP